MNLPALHEFEAVYQNKNLIQNVYVKGPFKGYL